MCENTICKNFCTNLKSTCKIADQAVGEANGLKFYAVHPFIHAHNVTQKIKSKESGIVHAKEAALSLDNVDFDLAIRQFSFIEEVTGFSDGNLLKN